MSERPSRPRSRQIRVRSRSRQLALRTALLDWYDEHGRALPWRRNPRPYRVWVAEVMLQQTRIAVVTPAYRRFLRAFPTLTSLAGADEEDVLALWSGLGYYSRARSLHRAARALRAAGKREFPRAMEAALQLPGVGAYTAAAVLSIAYGLPYAAVDGNIVRVLSRLYRLPHPDAGGEPHRRRAERLLDRERPGDWNQALMELGETICLPRAPQCTSCPVNEYCQAHGHDEVSRFPPPRLRRAPEQIRLRMTVVRDRSGRLLLERGAFPYLAHMWLPPTRIAADDSPAANGSGVRQRTAFRHAILHREFQVQVSHRLATVDQLRRQAQRRPPRGVERRVFTPEALARIGRSALLTKALAHLDRLIQP